jgi:5'-nucleotidase
MKMKCIASVLLSLFILGTPVSAGAENDHFKQRYIPVQILGINDFHGQLDVHRKVDGKLVGGASYLAAYLKKYEKTNKNTLLVHAGDVVGASPPISALLQDEPTIEFLNTLGFDVGTVGNHEFDEGVKEMKRLIYGGTHPETGSFKGADFPYVAANVVDRDTGEPILPPYVIKRVNGMPIGFIGVVTTDTQNIVLPSGIKDVTFTDETKAVNKAAQELIERGVKSIVVLSHLPAYSSKDGSHASGEAVDMAKKINDEVDVIFGGHNHAYSDTVVDGKLIVESYSYGTAFSDVDLLIDPKTKDIAAKQAKIVTTYHEGIKPDPEIKQMVEQYQEDVAPLVNRVVGQADALITENNDPSGESPLGNLVADSQRAQMQTDFAFMNPGGIRADLDEGDITWGELYTMLPFGNTLVKMTLTGKQIKQLLEQQWSGSYPRILQVSGLHYTWKKDAPAGEKIIEMADTKGNPIEPNKEYTVTVNNYIASGGDGFTVLLDGKNQVVGPLALEAMVNYIENFDQPIESPATGRIDIK